MNDYLVNCGHYIRGCQFVSPCCGNIVRCRLCHDDTYLNHQLKRTEVVEIICNNCSTRQNVSNECIQCKVQFGQYYCEKCRLYENNENKNIFHCDKCKICRIGNLSEFYHCEKCDMCYPLSFKDNHTCKEGIFKTDCIICYENLHTSTKPSIILPCKHTIHLHCRNEWIKKSIGCPMCRKTMLDTESYAEYIKMRDNIISNLVMEQSELVNGYCNDCNKSFETNFHHFGIKCINCGGYNTKL